MQHGEQFRQLIRPFPPALVHRAPAGKFGDYVAHYDIGQAALRIVGHHDFRMVELIRGLAPGIANADKSWKYPPRENAVVGVIGELVAIIDGRTVTIREVGTEDNPSMNTDAENAKLALSDAYKRCWMRLGLGLHLWADVYWLETQVTKDDQVNAPEARQPELPPGPIQAAVQRRRAPGPRPKPVDDPLGRPFEDEEPTFSG